MGSAVIYDRIHLMVRKLVRLREEHGHTEGVRLFKKEHGQEGVDEVHDYMVACSTPENYEAARKQRYPDGTVVIPLSRRKDES